MPTGYYERKGASVPYITPNPAYDSYKCSCGAIIRSKSPMRIEQHKRTLTHKRIINELNKSTAYTNGKK